MSYINYFLIWPAILVIAFWINFDIVRVSGISMMNTISDGDVLLMKRTKHVSYGDIVVLFDRKENVPICKRIIGAPNDTIKILGDEVFRNGKKIMEEYINGDWFDNIPTLELDDNSYYALGDNRAWSIDSRTSGPYNKNDIKGKIIFNITDFTGLKYNSLVKVLLLLLFIIIVITLISDNIRV